MTEASDAWLDVWASGGMHVPDGAAAAANETDKQARYPPAGGRKVIALSVETLGRLGGSEEELLPFLAQTATLRASSRGHDVVAGSFSRRWRAVLDGCSQQEVAAALRSTTHGLAGSRTEGGDVER